MYMYVPCSQNKCAVAFAQPFVKELIPCGRIKFLQCNQTCLRGCPSSLQYRRDDYNTSRSTGGIASHRAELYELSYDATMSLFRCHLCNVVSPILYQQNLHEICNAKQC